MDNNHWKNQPLPGSTVELVEKVLERESEYVMRVVKAHCLSLHEVDIVVFENVLRNKINEAIKESFAIEHC
tara:strand:- start:461 stop:673 length:213 start_codon:yes stop_codon:yes gene_type:complete